MSVPLGRAKGPFSSRLAAAAIPVEDLEQGAALVGESEDGAAAGIFVELGGDCVMEAVEAAARSVWKTMNISRPRLP